MLIFYVMRHAKQSPVMENCVNLLFLAIFPNFKDCKKFTKIQYYYSLFSSNLVMLSINSCLCI